MHAHTHARAHTHNHFTARNYHMYTLEENRQIKALAFITNTVITVVTDPVYVQLFLQPVTCFNPSTSIFHVATKFGERNEPFSTNLLLMGTINLRPHAHFPPWFFTVVEWLNMDTLVKGTFRPSLFFMGSCSISNSSLWLGIKMLKLAMTG